MSKMAQILKSDDIESCERHVKRVKKKIEDLNIELEINMDALERLRRK